MTTRPTLQSHPIHPHIQPQARLALSRKRGELTDLSGGAVYRVSRRHHARVRKHLKDAGGDL